MLIGAHIRWCLGEELVRKGNLLLIDSQHIGKIGNIRHAVRRGRGDDGRDDVFETGGQIAEAHEYHDLERSACRQGGGGLDIDFADGKPGHSRLTDGQPGCDNISRRAESFQFICCPRHEMLRGLVVSRLGLAYGGRSLELEADIIGRAHCHSKIIPSSQR